MPRRIASLLTLGVVLSMATFPAKFLTMRTIAFGFIEKQPKLDPGFCTNRRGVFTGEGCFRFLDWV